MSDPVLVPSVHAIFTWQADSETLRRLRPILEELDALADEPCAVFKSPANCLTLGDEPPPCLPCRLRLLRAKMHAVTSREKHD